MITKILNLIIKTGDTDKNLKKTNESIEDINKNLDKTDDKIKDVNKQGKKTKELKKGFTGAGKGIKTFTGGIKKMGLALKAAGIGLIIAAFASLKALFETNQTVVDAQATAFESLKIVFSELAKALKTVYDEVSKVTDNFNALGKVLMNILKIAVIPLRIQFQQIKGAVIAAQLAWESSFFGGQDADKIKDLKSQLVGVKDEFIQIGKDAFNSGKEIVLNFGEAAVEVLEIGKKVVEEVSKVNVKAAVETAKANVQLKKSAELLAVINQGLIEKYDRQAEQQRQIRDDERKTIQERIKANDLISEILDKQEFRMKANAQTALKVAENELKINSDNQAALIAKQEALNEIAAIEAQVAGFRSEQLTNQASLEKELLELNQAAIDGADERSVAEAEFTASVKKDTLDRLASESAAIELEKKLGEVRLIDKRNQFKEGTQAFLDANQELLTFQQESSFKQIENEIAFQDEIARIQEEARKEKEDKDKAAAQAATEQRQADMDSAVSSANQILGAITSLAQQSQQKFADLNRSVLDNENTTDKEKQKLLDKNNKRAKKAFDNAKAAQIAAALINTYSAAAAALSPPPLGAGPIFGPIAAAAALVSGFANVNQIRKQKFEATTLGSSGGGSASSGSSGGPSQQQAPQFNVVGQSGFNQIAGALGRSGPLQAYVVAGQVTTQQQLNNAIINRATF